MLGGRIEDVQLEDQIQTSYLDYSMSVIVGRALPDVRDGLKPVHRRILWSMFEAGLRPDRPYRKSAAAVGDVMRKYHPHGDVAIYDALVRMAQDFSLRAPLVDGHGNFGSVDGDPPAAQRYTEARLAPIALELLRDIEAETVDFVPNYDGYEQQPVVLPSRFPNLLVNGSGGIAVGMATNIPPHNLGEVIDAVVHFIDHPESKSKDLMKFVKGPDFPTGAIVLGRDGFRDAYETGRGSIKVRAVCSIEEASNGRQRIVVTELPYQVNKARLAEKIADLVRTGRLKDVADVKDHSSGREGMRLVIELKRGANPQVVLNQLYKHTQLQDSFGVIMLSLVDGVPRTLNLAEMIGYYVDHQIDVVTRRTRYELKKAEDRDHIVKGLLIALDNLDAVIKVIRGSQDAEEARGKLMTQFKLSEVQANHILDMPLRRLTRLARAELEQEHKELLARIRYLKSLLKDPKKIRAVISEEILEIKKKFATPRRTQLKADEGDLDVQDLIAEEDVVITVSRAGYVKRQPIENFRRQGRGGKGIRGANLKEEDVINDVFTTTTHNWLLFFTSKGKVYRVGPSRGPPGVSIT
ncbi:MAG TPA: DNA gyrase subunit A, partial [Planctomycetota bacterium]|nr:DNA gyrase subunit A [Planctomycetota bacterium]